MHVYFHLFGLNIPAYGTMIATGVLLANLIAYFLIKRDGKTFDDLLLVEAYAILGGFGIMGVRHAIPFWTSDAHHLVLLCSDLSTRVFDDELHTFVILQDCDRGRLLVQILPHNAHLLYRHS